MSASSATTLTELTEGRGPVVATHLFDLERAKRCYDLSYAQGTGILKRWNDGQFDPMPGDGPNRRR